MFFKPKGVTHIPCTPIYFQSTEIQRTTTIKFLGVLFQEQLSWSPHIDAIKKDLSRRIGILNRLRYYVPTNVKLQIYYALVHSRLTYCSLVWLTTTATNLNSLLILQNRAIRAISNTPLYESARPYFKMYKILPIKQLYRHKLCLEILHQYRLNTSQFLDTYYVKQTPYELRKNLIYKYRSRTNYGDQRLASQIPDILNKHPTILHLLEDGISAKSFKKITKELLVEESDAFS